MALSPALDASHQHGQSIRVLTLNCWGLKGLSKYRSQRLSEIGRQLAAFSPPLDIVGLQECWTYADYSEIRQSTRGILPYGKFYHSGIFGGGLVILSRWPIEDSSMFQYPLNGRPTAFFRGDWFVGKGVASARLRMPDGQSIEVFNTHLHAPYEREPHDSYICHRTAQAWEISKLMRSAIDRGSIVIGIGDFNMIPLSFAHQLIENRGRVRDAWRAIKPDSSIGASIDKVEIDRRVRHGLAAVPDLDESLTEHGHTCDTILNTWRWSETARKALEKGQDQQMSGADSDPRAKRLDYVFFGSKDQSWQVQEAKVTLTGRHATLRCSLSDHFAVEALLRRTVEEANEKKESFIQPIPGNGVDSKSSLNPTTDIEKVAATASNLSFFEDILAMIHSYKLRERKQRRWRVAHFMVSVMVTIGCLIAVWWSPRNFVAFLLMLLSSLGLMAGTLDGLIGGLFVGSELRALAEFEWEVRNAWQREGGPEHAEETLRDWYD